MQTSFRVSALFLCGLTLALAAAQAADQQDTKSFVYKKTKQAELFTAEGQGHGYFNRPPWQEKTTQRMDEFLVSIGYLEGTAIKSGN